MFEKKGVRSVLRGARLSAEERARFSQPVSEEEFAKICAQGTPSRLILLSVKGDPDNNIVLEYLPEEPTKT